MKDMRNVQAPDKLMGVATLLASVPKGVWYAATFFVFSLIGITAWVFHNNLDLVMKIIAYSIVVLVATAIITFYARLIYKAVMGVNSLSMASIEKKRWRALTLKAEAGAHKAVAEAHKAVLEVDMGYRYLPGMIERSIDGGKNYEYLGFKSNDRFSNVHTLQEGQLTPQIAQRSNFVPPTFADLVSTNKIIPGEETSILGYVDGEEKRDRWNKLYSFMVFGISGSGKSSTVAYYVALAVYHGARVFLIDPESEEDDSITKRLAPISHLFLVPVGATPTSARHVLAVAKQELDNPSDFPVIFIIDEFSTLMRKADVKGDEWGELGPTLKELVEDYAQRGRKRNRVAIVIGQIAGASRTGGTEVRNSMTAVFVHRLPAQGARLVIDADTARQCPQLETGEAMVMLTNSPIPLRMRIPYITPADMNTVAQMVGSHFGETDDMVYQQPEQLDEFREQKPIPFPRAIIPESNKRAEDVNLTEAIEYWNAFQPSTRDIEEEYELTNHQARRLRGFILDYADKRVSE